MRLDSSNPLRKPVFVKMMVADVFNESGLFVPEQLPADTRRYYFDELAKLGITIDETIL